EVVTQQIDGPLMPVVADGGADLAAAAGTVQAQLAHQPFHRAARHDMVERPGFGGGPDTWKGEGLWHPRGSTPLSCVNARFRWSLSCVCSLVGRLGRSRGWPASWGST